MKYRFVIFLSLITLLYVYTSFKMMHLVPNRRALGWMLSGILFILMMGWQFAYRVPHVSIDSLGFKTLAWLGSFSMGIWATFLIFSLPVDFLHLAFTWIQRFTGTWEMDPERREFFTTWLPAGLLSAAGGSTALGWFEVISGPKLREVDVPIEGLPRSLEGLKIAQISDLHIGPTIRRNFVAQVVEMVRGTQPDIIAVTGDLIDGIPERLKEHLEPLTHLKAPLGTFYVTGNHEYYWDAESWIATAQQLGFTPLINDNKLIHTRGSNLLLAGVTDTSAHEFIPDHRSDTSKAARTNQPCDLRILLAHRPDSCFEAEPHGFHLQLSGHTHAGQFFPWNLLVRFAHRYYRGLNRHGKMWVYVNAGTGYWGPAHRFLVPSEVTLIRFKSVQPGEKNGYHSV